MAGEIVAESDRELLELAAKAAGIELDWDIPENSTTPWRMAGEGDELGPAAEWNPRNDDGDAFRLETELSFSAVEWSDGIEVGELETVSRGLRFIKGRSAYVKFNDHSGDKRAARRLAGTLAAAEIGRVME